MSGSGYGISGLLNQALNLPETLLFGSEDPFIVGPVVLTDFEIPERVSWGGSQKITVHQLPGGERIFDVMGRDEMPISWSGIFLGRGALDRAKLLDVVRAQGDVIPLTFGTLSYKVVVESYSADYKQVYHIPYKISCKVLLDNAAPIPDNSVAADQSVSNDVSSATDSVPSDAPDNVVTQTTAETTPGSTVTQTYQPITQTAPTVANANLSGSNIPDSAVTDVDLGPTASTADISSGLSGGAAPVTGVSSSMSGAQSSADALSTSNASLFTGS